ncbi:MAG TPA: SMP-30/gluconolactonase/LRE family protein [Pilimelia sp.]|nr:SMP-30/gluconolactonase/LRE family protein [Pilimelia sp.]
MRRSTGLPLLGAAVALLGGLLVVPRADAAIGSPCVPGTAYGNPLPATAVTATAIRTGFPFLEGPVWHAASGTLLLSEMRNATGREAVQPASVLRFTPPATVETFIAQSGSNGLALSPDGSTLLAATHDQRTVSSYRLSDGGRGVVAANFGGRRFNSPNDLTVRADGTVYFTDPSFQRGNRADEQGRRTGVYRVKDGVVSLVDGTLAQPNGIVLSPDERTLYVGGGGSNAIYAYPVAADGSTGARRTFASVRSPDGATVDCAGNIYWASYNDGRVHVFDPAGRVLGTIAAGRNATNAAFGGADGRTLYVTAGTAGNFGLYSVRLNVPGSPF